MKQKLLLRREYASTEAFVAALFDYLKEQGGGTYFDSEVTQLEHALQAANLAREAGASDPLVAAALLHDIGHMLLGEHNRDAAFLATDLGHEKAGALLLSRWFAPAIATPVALHVSAKRYLVAVDPHYRKSLSPVSQQSLAAQGGPFRAAEAEEFAQSPYAQVAVLLRHWDDLAKVSDKVVPQLSEYAESVGRLVILPARSGSRNSAVAD